MKTFIIGLLLLSQAAHAQEERPKTGTVGPSYIGGMEYWPFDDSIPGSPYPDRVLWNYEEGSDAAKKCMLEANKKLVGWLKDEEHPVNKALVHYKEIGGTADFFMWTNDYTKAPQQAAHARRNRVWWWSGNGDETSGWLKFESTVLPDGTCKTPEAEQIVSYLENRYSLFAGNDPVEVYGSRRRSIFGRIADFFTGGSSSSESSTR